MPATTISNGRTGRVRPLAQKTRKLHAATFLRGKLKINAAAKKK